MVAGEASVADTQQALEEGGTSEGIIRQVATNVHTRVEEDASCTRFCWQAGWNRPKKTLSLFGVNCVAVAIQCVFVCVSRYDVSVLCTTIGRQAGCES